MMPIRLLCLLCLLTAAPAGADVFDDLSGRFGATFNPNTCARNPHRVSFDASRSRARFVWDHPITDFRGEERLEGSYEVLGHDDSSITMRIEGETRLTEDGAPAVWIMRRVAALDGYCWGRTDWPSGRCVNVTIRCPGEAPIS
ncbi:hypothetical protein MASR2M74_27320 [Paracoccaceae bacterium]